MIWEAFSLCGTSRLCLMRGRQNTSCYFKVMNDYLLPFADDFMPLRLIYQQDNAPIHVSSMARSWFSSNGFNLMQWHSRSLDLNPIENVWGKLARRVYMNNRQFNTVRKLTNCVFQEWEI